MKIKDPLPYWSEPQWIVEWGKSFENPITPAWDSYVNMETRPEDLIVFYRLAFPKFVEVHNCIVLEMKNEELTHQAVQSFLSQGNSTSRTEELYNSTSVFDLCSNATNVPEKVFIQMADLLAFSWKLALDRCFPKYSFEICISNTDKNYGPTVTFYRAPS